MACGKKPFEKRIDVVFKGPVFRDMTIGDPYDKVLKNEDEKFMFFPDSNILKYLYHVSDSEEYHWAYVFEDDKIKEIQFDAYLGAENNGEIYFNLIEKKYNKQLSNPVKKETSTFWEKDGVSAVLVNESHEAMMGKVRLIIYTSSDTSILKKYPFF
jgi:hypothetical protein